MGKCQDAVVQMGGSGEGAWGTVSRISADGASRTQLQQQTDFDEAQCKPSAARSSSDVF